MIQASQELIDYLNSTIREQGQYMRLVITTPGGTSYLVTDEDIVKGSLQITRSAVSGNSLSLGECYINDIMFTVIDKQNRFTGNLDNAIIDVYFGVVNTELGINEEHQIGRFQIPVDSTIRKVSTIQFNADSLLNRLDLPLNNEVFSGRPFSILQHCCNTCNLVLGHTQQEIEALSPNADFLYYVTTDSALTTYRDVVMYISQVLGGFATDDPEGHLIIKTYDINNDAYTLDEDLVETSNYGDSSYYLDALSYVYNGETKYAYGNDDSEYCLALDSNPLLENLEETIVDEILGNIWDQLDGVAFRSFDFVYNGNPLVELGDRLSYYSTIRQQQVTSFVTINKWKYHAKSTVTGSFLDKRTKVESQSVKKAATTGGGEGKADNLGVVQFVNIDSFQINTQKTKIADFFIALPKGAKPLLHFTIIVNVSVAGTIALEVDYDNVVGLLRPKYTLGTNYHTLSFTMSFNASDYDGTHHLGVSANFMSSGAASIDSYDTEIDVIAWKASDGSGEWTGIFNMNEYVQPITINADNIKVVEAEDNVSTTFNN